MKYWNMKVSNLNGRVILSTATRATDSANAVKWLINTFADQFPEDGFTVEVW